MKKYSIQVVRWVLWVGIGGAVVACGDDPMMTGLSTGQSGVGGTLAAAGGGAGMLGVPAAGSGVAGRSVAGSPAGAGAPGATAGSPGTAGGAAAGVGAAGTTGAAGAMAGNGAAGAWAAGSGAMAGSGAGSAAAGSGGAAAGSGAAGGGGSGAATGATWTEVHRLIMVGCTCHVTGSSGGLALPDKMTAYTNLVGANSTACSGEKRVVAGDPDKSVLFHSVARTQLPSCSRVPAMPLLRPMWSAADIAKVRSWIMAGAMNN